MIAGDEHVGRTAHAGAPASPASSNVVPPPLTSVALIEDHDSYRAFVAAALRVSGRYALIGSFGSTEEALLTLPKRPAAVALVDIALPGQSGIEAVAQLRQLCPEMRCVMLTGHEDTDHLFAALTAGASGYLLKTALAREILAGLDDVMAGGAPMSRPIARRVLESFVRPATSTADITLTARETEIMEQLAHGRTYKEIGRELGISAATVKNHLYRVYEKLGVRSRTEAAVKWLKR